jgi:hypothetical protein
MRKPVSKFLILSLFLITGCTATGGLVTDKEKVGSYSHESLDSTQSQNLENSEQWLCDELNFVTESGEVIPTESSTAWLGAYADEQWNLFITDYPDAPAENKLQLKNDLYRYYSKQSFIDQLMKLSTSYLLIENEDIKEIFGYFNALDVGDYQVNSETAAVIFDTKIQNRIDAVYKYCITRNLESSTMDS